MNAAYPAPNFLVDAAPPRLPDKIAFVRAARWPNALHLELVVDDGAVMTVARVDGDLECKLMLVYVGVAFVMIEDWWFGGA